MTHRLHEFSPLPLSIVWHENKTTYLSVRKQGRSLHLRLHRLFYDAPTPVLEALIQFALRRDRRSGAIIKQMAHLHFSKETTQARPLISAGSVYDLQEIFDRQNEKLQIEETTIGWSSRVHRGKFRSLTFGVYDRHCRQIRINPLLDDREVPLYFVEFIVYHEMLHAVCPTKIDGRGRSSIHTKEFRERERQYPLFKEAKEWGKKSLIFFKKRNSYGRS